MDEKLHKQLLCDTEELRSLVAECSTEPIVGTCAMHILTIDNSRTKPSPLEAPVRQILFLLGLMITSPEPKIPREFGPKEWKRSVELLNAIVDTYALIFWPTPEEVPHLTEAWHKVREVAMPAFLHYFGTTILATVEQVCERIQRYIVPFDAEFQAAYGLSATEALNVADWVGQHLQKGIDDIQKAKIAEEMARLALLDRAVVEEWTRERLQLEAQNESYHSYFEKMMVAVKSVFKVSRKDIIHRFDNRIANSYWNLFVVRRGEVTDFTYFTEPNPAEVKPLFEVSDGVAICPLANALYWTILRVGEFSLSKGEKKDTFFRKRDKTFEAEVEQATRHFFCDAADFFVHMFESKDLQFEHDLIIRWERRLFVIEAKASPPDEPFRDPDKAFVRIQRAFKSDRGIQGAYEQANRIRHSLTIGNSVDLYDSNSNCVAHLSPQDIDTVYCICVTRDDFGPLAADLSLLLEKRDADAYPWAVNILDLESLLDAWCYFGWGPEKLCEYLDARVQLNGKVFGSDELEFAGYFIRHGGLSELLESSVDCIYLMPQYSNVFDQIYDARHGGEQVKYTPTKPFMSDLREALGASAQETKNISSAIFQRTPKQGRNERCACGSGKKYKHCCGRNPQI